MGIELKVNLQMHGGIDYPRYATVVNVSEIIKAIEDAVAPFGMSIYSMKQDRVITFNINREPRNDL